MGMPVKRTGPDYPASEKGVLAEKPCRRDDRAVLQGLLDALTRLGAAVRAQQVDFFAAGPAAITMPSEIPNFIFRGLRLAIIMVRRPLSLDGSG